MTVYILAGRQGSNRERLTKLILFGGVTGAGLRPLLNFAIMVNPNLVPTALILTASVFICFSLVSFSMTHRLRVILYDSYNMIKCEFR